MTYVAKPVLALLATGLLALGVLSWGASATASSCPVGAQLGCIGGN